MNTRKKLLTLVFVLPFVLAASASAGPIFFSSSNEQYGIIANAYDHAAVIGNVQAESAYLQHVLAALAGDSDTANEAYNRYVQLKDAADDAMEKANIYYGKIILTAPDPLASNLKSLLLEKKKNLLE